MALSTNIALLRVVQLCPVVLGMSTGRHRPWYCLGHPRLFRWCDGVKYKKPTSLNAPSYITLLMEWVEAIINDESIFPVQVGTPFPKNFRSTCKKLLSRLYRVFVHVYVHHFDRIIDSQAVGHLRHSWSARSSFCVGAARQHVLQAFLLFLPWVWSTEKRRDGTTGKNRRAAAGVNVFIIS